ncbi:hypothetical protein BpHYR1_046484 [Brachionus plicatilis]|uniref:Uncharacterized protein n=1 Tax=Brachionus plicatilis TaxID=10195 RepID=A0A3M7P7N4_BRAPC|nr:hypothetical protein BpHYR1_046484 [Brachionus plicatilis]
MKILKIIKYNFNINILINREKKFMKITYKIIFKSNETRNFFLFLKTNKDISQLTIFSFKFGTQIKFLINHSNNFRVYLPSKNK